MASTKGSIHVVLSGGPLDGAHYGDMPDPGKPVAAARLSIPLTQPADTSARAIYVCERPAGPDGIWEYTFQEVVLPVLPVGTTVAFA